MRYKKYLYVWCVMVDDGFYMEPDVSIFKVFLDYKAAKKCCELQKKHRSSFIEKRRLYLWKN